MIQKGGHVYLYMVQENHIRIRIRLNKHGSIKTYWYWRDSVEDKKDREKWCKKAISTLRKLKINGCAICGYNRCIAALDFHHVNPQDKKFQITKQRIYKKNFIDELNKCILLCANCHREIEEKQRRKK